MTNFELFKALGCISAGNLSGAEQLQTAPRAEVRRKSWKRPLLVAAVIALALLLVGCAVAYALTVFGSPAEMIAGRYGGADSAAPFEDSDPDRPNAAWTVPGYEKSPVEETVAQELQKWVSPVGKSISTDSYTLTVDAYVYDSTTQCGFITRLLTHDAPIELSPGRNNLLGSVPVNFNQYGYAYLIPEKTTDTQLAFTYYFRADMQNGTNLLVSFPDFEEEAKWEEYEENRPAEVEAIRERLKQELTPQEAAEKMEALGYGSGGYTGEYDDYYYLAAHEYDAAHSADRLSEEDLERQALEKKFREELTPEEAVEQLRSLWGDELVDETFGGQTEEMTAFAYLTLAKRAYEQAHMDEMVCVSLPDGGSLPHRTFGQGDVYVNSLCVRVRSSRYAESGDSVQTLIFHMTDGTDFVVVDSLTDNTLFKRIIEHGDSLYMLNSAINIDKKQSVEVVGKLSGTTLEADAD